MLKINNHWKVYTIAEIIHYNCVFINLNAYNKMSSLKNYLTLK